MKSTHQELKQICVESTNRDSNKEQYCVEKYTESRNVLSLKEQRNERRMVRSSRLLKDNKWIYKSNISNASKKSGKNSSCNEFYCIYFVDNDDGEDVDMAVFFLNKGRDEEHVCEVHICKKEMPC